MAQLVYLDETELRPAGKKRAKPTHLKMVALVVDEGSIRTMGERMEAVMDKNFDWPPGDFEFHGRDIWHGNGYWGEKSHEEKLQVLEDLIAIVAEIDCFVAHSTIDLAKLHEKYDGKVDGNAYLLALQFVLEKIDAYQSSSALRVVVADEKHEQELRAARMVGRMQRFGAGEVPGRKLKTIIDNLHFVDSKASYGVQLADIVAYILERRALAAKEHPNAQAALERMGSSIWAKVRTYREPWPR